MLPVSPGCWFRSFFPVQSVSVTRFVVTVSISKCTCPADLYSLTEICNDYSEFYLSLNIYIFYLGFSLNPLNNSSLVCAENN